MNNITEVFDSYLSQYGSVDIAESEFKKNLHEDAEMRKMYRQWCDEVGSSEKSGFFDYCEEYFDSQNDIWNTLNDYDDE
ncbi:MAG: hypothetical protein NC338_05965 [Firmicutes bacterium]|nr:hypothetical protein [Bacillota bacterium]MCM1400421.1 hypothetical protein [Bacteroides sp.]MCM1477631.1 hypothetical protein [Bacteroides sp.]